MGFELYNTVVRRVEPLVVGDGSRVTFYTCGPTVYDDAHIGNFRAFLAADVLRRWLESPMCEVVDESGRVHGGPRRVVHVMNITDVGHMTDDEQADGGGQDKMQAAAMRIAEAKKSGKLLGDGDGVGVDPSDPYAIAAFYADRFLEDAKMLGLKVAIEAEDEPELMPRPTQKIDQMIVMIQRLIERGHAYVTGQGQENGAVYFDVSSYGDYGKLSGNTLDALRAGAGGRVSQDQTAQKKHAGDFLLWKADPSHLMKWDSPWGAGYPGWHLECSAMALEALAGGLDGAGVIDLHSGGEDNIFPHHECEMAQSCCATGSERFARCWFHARHLMIEGEKMSKSKGNYYTARDLFGRGIQPAALRLELIKTHYRTNANFTMQGLKDSQRIVDRWRRVAVAFKEGVEPDEQGEEMLRSFAHAMDDDLNVSGAIGVFNSWLSGVGEPTAADAAAVRLIDDVLGTLELVEAEHTETAIGVLGPGVEPDAAIEGLLNQRKEARAAKDFARADEIRGELEELGLEIRDLPEGRVQVSLAGG